MISRFNYMLWLFAGVLCVALYYVKYDAQHAERRLATLSSEIVKEREELRLLQAEWAVRTEPQRLERLAARYLDLSPVRATQIVAISDLPLPDMLEPLQVRHEAPMRDTGEAEAVLATLALPRRSTEQANTVPLPRPSSDAPRTPEVTTLPVIPRKHPFKRVN